MIKTEVCCELSAMLRPKTYPFAIKLYQDLNHRPEGTLRPRHPMNVCQITAIVRYYVRIKRNKNIANFTIRSSS